jgi:hypothetical protein
VSIDLRDLAVRVSRRPAVICSREVGHIWRYARGKFALLVDSPPYSEGVYVATSCRSKDIAWPGPGFAKTGDASYGLGITGLPRVAQEKGLASNVGEPEEHCE